MRILIPALIMCLLTACKSAPQDTPKADATADTANTAAPAGLPAGKGVALEAYSAPEGFKAAWDAAAKGGSVKALCEVWLGGSDKGMCFEDTTAKRAALGAAQALAFVAEIHYPEEEGGMGGHMDAVLIVEHDGRFYAETLASAHNGGVGYAGGDVEIKSMTAQEVADGGAAELIVEIEESSWDGDMSANTREFRDATETGVLQLQQGGPRWRMFATTATRSGEEIMMEGEEPTPTLDAPKESKAKLVWHAASAEVEPQGVEGIEPIYPLAKVSIDAMPQRDRKP